VIFNSGGLQVAVVENGVVHLRRIGVVRDLGREVEVNSGVKRGDQVILNPSVDLAEGAKVENQAVDRRVVSCGTGVGRSGWRQPAAV